MECIMFEPTSWAWFGVIAVCVVWIIFCLKRKGLEPPGRRK